MERGVKEEVKKKGEPLKNQNLSSSNKRKLRRGRKDEQKRD